MKTKFFLMVLCVAAMSLAIEFPARAADFTVNSTQDAVDAKPGDGICATAAGTCTLRAAIQEANALPGADRIFVPGAVYTLTIPGAGEDCAATGDLDITDDLTIYGAGPEATIVDGGGLDRIFQILPPQPQCNTGGSAVPNVTIKGMTVRNGSVTTNDSGGGIFNGIANQQGGFLKLVNVTVTGNSATYGGGIMNGWGASAELEGVTVSSNSAAFGAGLYTRDAGKVTVSNSTFSNNAALTGGGGIDTWSNANLALQNVTIAQNSAVIGAGINREFNSNLVTLKATIVANNAGGDCVGAIVSHGHNLDSDSTCSLTQATDLPGRNPLLGPLQDNRGPTRTRALLDGSPAIDAGGTSGCLPADQRLYLRPGDGIACDIGAYEKGTSSGSRVTRR
jgi:CSLREA domain-containing protein